MRFKERVRNTRACLDAVEWINGRGMKRAYEECERADWMLWMYGRMADKPGWATRQEVVLAACDCAATSLQHYSKKHPNDDRPKKAIETARKWAKGKAAIEDVRIAADAATAANAADAADAADAKTKAHKRMCKLIRKRLACPKKWGE